MVSSVGWRVPPSAAWVSDDVQDGSPSLSRLNYLLRAGIAAFLRQSELKRGGQCPPYWVWSYLQRWCDEHGTQDLLDEIRALLPKNL